jgi:hypothetical protein
MGTLNPIKTPDSVRSPLRKLPTPSRLAFAGLLLASLIAYAALLISTYLHLTPPSSLFPDLRELSTILFETKKPISRIERLLESSDGEMNRGGTMRPAFTDKSLDWESLTQSMTDALKSTLLAQREAERLALLDWVRSGASRTAYDNDNYEPRDATTVSQITPDYLIPENDTTPSRVRLKTLIADRCVTCHGENGRHDTARYIALDTYDRLAPHLRPETTNSTARVWLISALIGLYPLALISGLAFFFTSHPANARRILLITTFVALGGMSACWLAGRPAPYAICVLLATFTVAAVDAMVQTIASLAELLKTDRG